jgi:hypothetical protein
VEDKVEEMATQQEFRISQPSWKLLMTCVNTVGRRTCRVQLDSHTAVKVAVGRAASRILTKQQQLNLPQRLFRLS